MKKIIHKANTRGHADHGWLNAWHSFSFAGYHDPERVHFGMLRVLNDDTVAAGMGFGSHPHNNMEIITIPTYGDLQHRDSMGNSEIIKQGDIQVMSAGSGITHSEINPNKDKEVKLFQIWVFPNKRNVEPRYDQVTLDESKLKNNLYQVVSPNKDDEGVWIHQDAWFSLGDLGKGFETTYKIKRKENGVYAFVIEGDVTINDEPLSRRDAIGISETDTVTIKADSNTRLLIIDVPMN